MKSIALIPAYEPDETMLHIVEELFEEGFSIVIVNDGSSQSTARIFDSASEMSTVLAHPENRGKGAALKTGIRFLLETVPEEDWSETILVTVDADGQHRTADVLATAREAGRQPGSLVLGRRHFTRSVPLRSRFGNSLTRGVFHLAARKKLTDTQTGLRACTLDLGPRLLSIEGERYEYEMNMLLAFAREHVPIVEVPIETVYLAGNASSHFRAVQDSLRIYRDILKLTLPDSISSFFRRLHASLRIYRDILKFALSSLAGFLADFALFSLISSLTAGLGPPSIALSNILARVASASLNFSLNRKLVFKSRDPLLPAALKYALLAGTILIGNTLLLGFLTNVLGLHRLFAKLLTEVTFFTLSWLVQKYLIFRIHQPRHAAPTAA